MGLRLADSTKFSRFFQLGKSRAEAKRLEESLYEFVKAAWHVFDPAEFDENWHLADVCAHLEAVARGNISRLLINVPPRTGKTAIVSICFPAWVWAQRERGPRMGPQVSFFYTSYAEVLSLEHSLKTRRLVESRWYQGLWGDRFRLVPDRNTKSHFENDKGGYRMASSVDAKATGFGADILIADDPHLVKEAESDTVREDTVKWWTETMPSRMNDRRTGAMIVVMQRVHEGDLSGFILDRELGYTHICIPMSYEPCFHVNAWVGDKVVTVIGEEECGEVAEEDVFWVDARTEEFELLWPVRYSSEEVAKIERELGPYAYAGQYQQHPAPRGGGIIRVEWWRAWDDDAGAEVGAKPGTYPPCEYILGSLDTALTEDEENDPSALSIWGVWRDKNGNPNIVLMMAWAEYLALHELTARVGEECKRFKVDLLLVEDKAAGHSASQELQRIFGLMDFGVQLIDPRKGFIKSPDKAARLQTVVHMFAEGMIWAPIERAWVQPMIKQCATVPRAVHDDLADTCSQALIYLRRAGWAARKVETAIEVEDELKYRPRSMALYPA